MIAAVPQTGTGGYAILFLAVAASWIGIPLIGAGVLAAAGVLASEGELNLWWVIIIATAGAWSGGYVGYVLGRAAGDALADRPGLWHRRRRRSMRAGERLYGKWGRIAVFVTPTFVSGALKMPCRTFLAWNALAALVSTSIAAVGAYGIGAAVLDRLSSRNGVVALAVAGLASGSGVLIVASRRWSRTGAVHRSHAGEPLGREADLAGDADGDPSLGHGGANPRTEPCRERFSSSPATSHGPPPIRARGGRSTVDCNDQHAC